MKALHVYNDHDELIAQVDDDGVAHIVHNGATSVRLTLTVQRGDETHDHEFPICANPQCMTCHPIHDIFDATALLPSAFAYLFGEPHAQ